MKVLLFCCLLFVLYTSAVHVEKSEAEQEDELYPILLNSATSNKEKRIQKLPFLNNEQGKVKAGPSFHHVSAQLGKLRKVSESKDGCFDFNFVAYKIHFFGFVSSSEIPSDDLSVYDYYFIETVGEEKVYIYGYEEASTPGDESGTSSDVKNTKLENPAVRSALAEAFQVSANFNFRSGTCFDYRIIKDQKIVLDTFKLQVCS